jgi:hypothetical protein
MAFGLAVVVLLGALLIALVVWLVCWGREQQRRREAVWRRLAAARGGVFREAEPGFWRHTPASIEAPIGQAIVFVDTYVVSSGNSATTYTRARARFAIGRGPVFRVHEEGFFQSLGKALGAQDVELGGDPVFDAAYVVKCDDPQATRRAWTPRAKRDLRHHPRRLEARSDGREVTVTALGALDDAGEISAMMDLAAELASHGARELTALAQAVGGTPPEVRGGWEAPSAPTLTLATERGPAVARVVPGGALGLDLALAHERAGLELAAELRDGHAEDLPKGVLTDAAAALLPKVGRARLRADARELLLTWPTLPAPAELTAGARLLAELAGGTRSLGAFR